MKVFSANSSKIRHATQFNQLVQNNRDVIVIDIAGV